MQPAAATADDAPLVSVIIPTYNYGHFVTQAIDSIKRQDYVHTEIIVIDDGSTDQTQTLLRQREDIRYIYQANQGLSAARNRGIDEASGKYLLFLDADDLLGKGSIRERVRVLERDPHLAFAVCGTRFFSRATLPDLLSFPRRRWRLPEKRVMDLALCFFNIAPPHAYLVRKAVIDNAGLRFDTDMRACEDYDFWFRVAVTAGLPAPVDYCHVYYRQHPGSMSHSRENQRRHDARMCERILHAFDGSRTWLGTRQRQEYLYPMLASALVTARRLWRVDKAEFARFMSGHVQCLVDRLRRDVASTPDPDIVPYIRVIWSESLRMLIVDRCISPVMHERLIDAVPSTDPASCAGRSLFQSLALILRTVRFHIHYATLKYLRIDMARDHWNN